MRMQDESPTISWPFGPLPFYELPKEFVEPAVRSCRWFNTLLDFVFYDVPTLRVALTDKDASVTDSAAPRPSLITDFDALSDPEGSLLIVDAKSEHPVHEYRSVEEFLAAQDTRHIDTVTITGVGSSALGSAALAWDVSVALGRPVVAIVPGYGVADVMLQALGGWFAFGLYNALHSKTWIQTGLAMVAPETARIGRKLAASIPHEPMVNGAPVSRSGSGSSDALHALLQSPEHHFKLLVGHSKGALQIENALHSLDQPDMRKDLRVVTLACPISKDVDNVTYDQYLGIFDALGNLNAWGNWPDHWSATWHTTNPFLPPAMNAGEMTRESVTAANRLRK